jgi:hypothetical protein
VRTGLSKVLPVPGEIFTMDVERTWVFGHTRFAKGLITASVESVLGLQFFRDCEDAQHEVVVDSHPVSTQALQHGPDGRQVACTLRFQ